MGQRTTQSRSTRAALEYVWRGTLGLTVHSQCTALLQQSVDIQVTHEVAVLPICFQSPHCTHSAQSKQLRFVISGLFAFTLILGNDQATNCYLHSTWPMLPVHHKTHKGKQTPNQGLWDCTEESSTCGSLGHTRQLGSWDKDTSEVFSKV